MLSTACSDEQNTREDQEFTGREMVYDLLQASEFPIEGTVVFRERMDKSIQIEVRVSGTSGNALHPVHLHYGNLSIPDADLAAQLNDLSAEAGESITIVPRLLDESVFEYDYLRNFDGSVKIHLAASGEGSNVILAGGNIGIAAEKQPASGRINIAVCKSE
ncbi:hypothetical protein C900_02495 [Fulvivirga imtechensis AK7]|uniref:Uncharacterized protein n=2 Tax=Fulvivirga TaxID=396811 RepID=L8JRU0_9BACT|nr:hypothetical protein C900_02495 [Fulvivirga imtechensis AK7]